MKYILDTNVCIIYLKGINLNVKQRLKSVPIQKMANNVTLVKHHIREFGRVDGLQVEDWEVGA